MPSVQTLRSRVLEINAAAWLLIALALAVGVALSWALAAGGAGAHSSVLARWDAAVSVWLAHAALVVQSLDARRTSERVRRNDQRGPVVLLIIVTAACTSLVAITWACRRHTT